MSLDCGRKPEYPRIHGPCSTSSHAGRCSANHHTTVQPTSTYTCIHLRNQTCHNRFPSCEKWVCVAQWRPKKENLECMRQKHLSESIYSIRYSTSGKAKLEQFWKNQTYPLRGSLETIWVYGYFAANRTDKSATMTMQQWRINTTGSFQHELY